MAIRPRATVQLLRVVQASYSSSNMDKLVASIRDFDDNFSSGLISRLDSRVADGWEGHFRSGSSLAFVDMLGVHCMKLPFDRCLEIIASPAHYCNSMGFSVWANKALLIYSSCALHKRETFWPTAS